MNIRNTIETEVAESLKALGIENAKVALEHPADFLYGDYSSNAAMVYSKVLGMKPRDLAEKIIDHIKKASISGLEKIEIAGPGFINFILNESIFTSEVKKMVLNNEIGKTNVFSGKKIFFEYTQPNPFKEFHIGHLMNNMIGEALSRILEHAGAQVKRATYHGDVGIHVAKTIYGLQKENPQTIDIKTLGDAYAKGNEAYETDPVAKTEIIEINKKVYEKSDETINRLYEMGKKISFDYFEELYKKLGSTFDFHFLESETAGIGKEIVLQNIDNQLFEKSEGAVIFRGEKYGLHTRVFLNKEGIPTYEAKELGLAKLKEEKYPFDVSITITANEQREYFKVVKKAIELLSPELEGKIVHLSHGMLKLPSGKMSSRTGTIIRAETLIAQIEDRVLEKIKDREFSDEEKKKLAFSVALAAIRYSILRQSIGGDIIFNIDTSISFEGDSGPYLQYACVRAQSVVNKFEREMPNENEALLEYGDSQNDSTKVHISQSILQKMLVRFNEIVERSALEYAPHHIVTYLIELSSAFNVFYTHNQIIDIQNVDVTKERIVVTKAFVSTMKKGLYLLGVDVPQKM